MTLIDILAVVGVIALIAACLYTTWSREKAKAIRMNCVNNLKQTGLAFIVWSGDNGGEFPMAVPQTNGGTMEFITGPNVFRHFQVMSNELSTARVVLCPTEDDLKDCATNWINFSNSNISYFVGVDAKATNANMILAGDHNITDGSSVKNGLLEFTADKPASWTREMHNKIGNIALADGSVQQDSSASLQAQIVHSGVATNRLQMP